MDLVVRTTSDPARMAAAVRSEIQSLDKTTVVTHVATLEQRLGESASQRRFQTWLLGLFSAIALILTAIGAYGLMHYSVAQRTREIGVRIALGAQTRDVLTMVVRQGPGVRFDRGCSGPAWRALVTDAISSLLFGVAPTDPVTFAVVPALLIAVALLASYIPARRAAKVDPMVALRYE